VGEVRRTAHAFFSLEDDYVLDVDSLMQGIPLTASDEARIVAMAVLTGERHAIDKREWEVLVSIPSDRSVDGDGFDPDVLGGLLDKGLVVSDSSDSPYRELRERDAAMTAAEWHPYATLYHYLTQWTGVDIRHGDRSDTELAAETAAGIRELVADYGLPPAELPHVASDRMVALPARARSEPFFGTLMKRHTTRAFDSERPMSLDDLDTVLRYVFGVHGYASRVEGVVCIKRTSPSGGGLHPITVYPIVANVEGIAPGVYHYNAGDHSLALLSSLTIDAAHELASTFMAGQSYFGTAHVSFVLVARFYRNHWKYRRHARAYAGILMDAAHLSQTLYLVAAEIGLGAFVTIAINGRDIEERLGLDGVEAGPIAVCGCGPRLAQKSPLEPRFTPDRPPRTT
jgi:putative peptide maturation dehydrogenase